MVLRKRYFRGTKDRKKIEKGETKKEILCLIFIVRLIIIEKKMESDFDELVSNRRVELTLRKREDRID